MKDFINDFNEMEAEMMLFFHLKNNSQLEKLSFFATS